MSFATHSHAHKEHAYTCTNGREKNSSFHIPNVSLSNLTFFLVKKGKPIRMSSLLFAKTVSKRDNVMDCIGLKLSESDTLIKSVCARKNVLKNILFCLHIHSSFEVCQQLCNPFRLNDGVSFVHVINSNSLNTTPLSC